MLKMSNKMATFYIGSEVAFTNHKGSFVGRASAPGFYGRLPNRFEQIMRASHNDIDYVVYSYFTPIAWKTSTGWKVPKVKYSNTTSKHQAIVLEALKHKEALQIIE